MYYFICTNIWFQADISPKILLANFILSIKQRCLSNIFKKTAPKLQPNTVKMNAMCRGSTVSCTDTVLWCTLKATLIESRGVFHMKEALHNTDIIGKQPHTKKFFHAASQKRK